MGLFDKLKKGLKEVAHGAKILAVNIQITAAMSAKKRELKRILLNRFSSRQLDEIAIRFSIPISGARTKDEKINILARHLSFNDVVKLAKRYKVKYKDIVDELDKFKAMLESKKASVKAERYIENIIQVLQAFKPEPVRDEEDLEKQLYQYLKAKLPNLPIKRQVQVGPYRVDILIGKCGIEIKVPRSKTHLQRLLGQVGDYLEYTGCVIALILDVGISGLERYVERLAERGVIPIVVKGTLKSTQRSTSSKTQRRRTLQKSWRIKRRKYRSAKRR